MTTPQYLARHDSPLGPLLVVAGETALGGIWFDAQKHFPTGRLAGCIERETPLLKQARRELDEYFAGRRERFTLPCAPDGTPFQRAVWSAIALVPYGQTISYGELARRAGHAASVRAVGAATGRNPVGIVIPCHRIVGGDGSLTGYAGGLDRKRTLLALERAAPRAAATTRCEDTRSLALF